MIFLHSSWYILAQLLGEAYPTFELNVFRFITQTLLCALLSLMARQSLLLQTKTHYALMTGSSLAYTAFILSMYICTLFLPLANLDGVLFASFIVYSLIVALAQRNASVATAIAALLAITGILFIVQPGFLFDNATPLDQDVSACPCSDDVKPKSSFSTLQRNPHDNATVNVSKTDGNTPLEVATSRFNDSGELVSTEDASYFESKLDEWKGEMYGYGFAALAGIMFGVCTQINSTYLVQTYHSAVISFWNGIVGVIISLILMAALETPYFTTGLICVVLLIIHCLDGSLILVCCNIAWVHVPPEEFAILETSAVVLLYIAQSTFMREYHPPHGNWEEALGIALVVVACLLDPVCTIVEKVRKKRKSGDTEQMSLLSK